MWKKVPLSGLEPYVPTSSEWLMARAQASATAQGRAVVAPGWAPPVPAAAAPLQLVASTVVEPAPEPSPAGTEPHPRSVPSAVPSADVSAPAGEAPATPSPGQDDPAWQRALKAAQAQFKKILGGEDRPERLALAAQILRLDDGSVRSLNHLTLKELRDIGATLNRAENREQLDALLRDGEASRGE
jgi:hypothetical protein